MLSRLKCLYVIVIILLMLSACSFAVPDALGGDLQHGWRQADLMLLKAPGNALPEHTIIAFYERQHQANLEFRLDLLDMQDPFSNTVYLALDTQPGGNDVLLGGQPTGISWDVLFVFPAVGNPYAQGANGDKLPGLIPRIARDPELNTFIIQINKQLVPGDINHFRSQAFLLSNDASLVYDQTPPVSAGTPFAAYSPILFAFWDILPAATPVQALRRWDGAHTGPYGRRHGLSVLLHEASSRSIPVALLDLKTPASLSALDMLGGTRWLQNLEEAGSVILPQTAYGDTPTSASSLETSDQTTLAFGFRTSQIGYGPFNSALPTQLKATFYAAGSAAPLLNWNNVRLIPLPSASQSKLLEPDDAGPSLEFKKQLLKAAFSQTSEIVTIGGPLPASSLADSGIAPLFFEYIATHPWIHPLSEADIFTLPAKNVDQIPLSNCLNLLCASSSDSQSGYNTQNVKISQNASQIRAQLRNALSSLPPSSIKDQAWQAYFQLSSQNSWIADPSIQANYIGQVGNLIAAARWATNPAAQAICSQDINWDGQPDCILASQDLFAIIAPDGGRLVFFGSRAGHDIEQWVGTKTQFFLDLENSDLKPISAGLSSDPGEIPGAFFDYSGFEVYQTQTAPAEITLIDSSHNLTKTFNLKGNTLNVEIQSTLPYKSSIPITLNPAGRFTPAWAQTFPRPVFTHSTWSWNQPRYSSIQVKIAQADLVGRSFLDSLSFMIQPEIPDRAYPAGHYIPFPLAVLDLQSQGSFTVTIAISP
jgi:hypothetical protein